MTTVIDRHGREGELQEGGCPRRLSHFDHDVDVWVAASNACGYCGSLHPDVFMQRLEAQDVELGPTDKHDKVYVTNTTGAMFKEQHKTGNGHWVTRSVDQVAFRFQHLSIPQRQRFIELLNAGQLRFGYPGHFYTRPFLITYEKENTDGHF